MKKKLADIPFAHIDREFRRIDRRQIRRTKNIRLIPGVKHRKGGKVSYAEWAHVIGIFQSLIYQTLDKKTDNHILDIGCGKGLIGIAAEPFVLDTGLYTGLDVMEREIDFCMNHYVIPNYKFIHHKVANPRYAQSQNTELTKWPLDDESQDMVTALSVWTHLNERDSIFYFKEIYRVLKKGGKAIVTFFYLDEKYQESLSKREDKPGKFHKSKQTDWIFDIPAYESKNWLCPQWVKYPEDAIGVTPAGMQLMTDNFKLTNYYPGNWKEYPGMYFQDILIFEK